MKRKLASVIAIIALLAIALSASWPPLSPAVVEPVGTRAAIAGLVVDANISKDTTWDLTFPFIYVTRDIWVLENAVLTVLPDVEVRFEIGARLHIMGGINADGSIFKPISFIPYAENPATMDWKGITIENATHPCIFNYARVKYSEIGIGIWGSDPKITNCSIEFTHYYGILCGEASSPVVMKNYINFTTWAGVVCGNGSTPFVENNTIITSYYGIVCYDVAQVKNNTIETCWLGIIGWGNSTISYNTIYKCMDGIHGFYASPRIENNVINNCDGNGTRFIHSNATLRNNRLVYNHVGMDIDYDSRSILGNMVNNLVNGIEITDCFYVGEKNLVIDGLFVDSGWSRGYYGTLTAQGSVTLYDCSNVTIRDSTVINTMNSIYATNSTFTIYNSVFDNARKSQIHLDENATGVSFNRSVDPESVTIGGVNCLFQTFENLDVQVLDYYGLPIEGARVAVRESQLELYNVTTDPDGDTPTMVVKDRTVSDAGVIASPLSVQVYADGYNFAPNPRTGVYAIQTPSLVFTDLGDIFPPQVAAVSVTDGDREFPVDGNITITFSEPMNRASVESAFSITGNVTGTFAWSGFNMTFTPIRLEHAAYYTVTISTSAMDAWNNSLEAPIAFSFTTVKAPGAGSTAIIIAVIAIFAISGIAGYLVLRKLK